MGRGSSWTVPGATLLFWLSTQALLPFVGLHLRGLGSSDATVGLVLASHPLASLLLAVPLGRELERRGLRAPLVGALIGLGVFGAGLGFTSNLPAFVGCLFGWGICSLVSWLALQALVAEAGSVAQRRRQLTAFSLAWGIGIAAGPTVGAAIYDLRGFRMLAAVFVVSAFVTVGVAVWAPSGPSRPSRSGADSSGEPRLVASVQEILADRTVARVLLSGFVIFYVQSIRLSFFPIYLEAAGLSVTHIGVLLSVIGWTSLVVRTVLPAVERRMGTGRVLWWSIGLAILGIGATPLLVQWHPGLVGGAVLVGVGLGVAPPVSVQVLAERMRPGQRGTAVGLRVMTNRFAQVVQPIIFGGLASIVGAGAVFPVSGIMLGSIVALSAGARRVSGRAAAARIAR